MKTPSKSSRLYNSSDILRYLYSFYLGQYPQRAAFLAPTPAALEMEAKIDQFGIDARRLIDT